MTLISNGLRYLTNSCRQWQRVSIRNRQRDDMAKIYDGMVERVPAKTIKKHIHSKMAPEIERIIDFVDRYRTLEPPSIPQRNYTSISVVIPHYHHYEYLDLALTYLERQTDKAEEVLIVDDISPDQSRLLSVIKAHQKKLPLRLLKPKLKLYPAKARQYGAENAKSDVLLMHDADDISHKNRIALTRSFFQSNKNAMQLNIGYVEFYKKAFFDYLGDFSNLILDDYVVTTSEIIQAMRAKFINQQLSIPDAFRVHFGGYGAKGKFGFLPQSGHVAYRKEVVSQVAWTSTPTNYIFTHFEDFEFNFLLLLAFQASYQLDIPLIYYRRFTSTNVVSNYRVI